MRSGTTFRRWTVAAAALGLLATVSACGSDADSPAQEDGASLVLAIGGEDEAGFDPTRGWGRYGSPLFQSTLLARNADLSLSGDLATDYSLSDDGLVWTVDLRTDATFTDGEPVTASDVAYTFTTAASQGGLTDVTALATAEAIDDDTVELTLKKPDSTFVNRLVSLGIVPEHAHGEEYAQAPVGSGPFTFSAWEKGQQLVVTRNDDYYGEMPAFERLTFLFTDEDSTLAAARAGQVDVAGVPAALATQEIEGMDLQQVASIDNRGIAFPTVIDEGKESPAGAPIGNDVTADAAIRQAVNVAVDRAALVEGVLEGFGSPAHGPADNSPWFNPASVIEDADPERAAEILAAAGWKDADGDGTVEKDGLDASFTLLYPAGDSLRQGIALSVVDQVAEAGIEIRTEGVGWEEIYQRQHADAVMFGWGSHDPREIFNLYHSSMAGIESFNVGYYANDDVDAALEAALAATDLDDSYDHFKAAQINEDGVGFAGNADAAWAWLVNLDHTYFTDSCLDLGEMHIEPHGHGWPVTANITEWAWTC